MHHELQQTKKNLEKIEGITTELYQKEQKKKDKLKEILKLQSPEPLKIFYHTIQKNLSAKFMSALMLVGGMVERSPTMCQKVCFFLFFLAFLCFQPKSGFILQATSLGNSLVGGLIGGLPFVGSVAESLICFGVDEISSAAFDYFENKKTNSVTDSLSTSKDAMNIAELISRKLSQQYGTYISSLNFKKSTKYGEKAAETVYSFIAKGKLKGDSMEEKVSQIGYYINKKVTEKKGFWKTKKPFHYAVEGKVQDNPDEEQLDSQIHSNSPRNSDETYSDKPKEDNLELDSPASIKQSQDPKKGSEQHANLNSTESTSTQSSKISVPSHQIAQMASLTGENLSQAIALFESLTKNSNIKTEFYIYQNDATILLSSTELGIDSKRLELYLDSLAHILQQLFDKNIIEDCDIEEGILILTTRSTLIAKKLREMLLQNGVILIQKKLSPSKDMVSKETRRKEKLKNRLLQQKEKLLKDQKKKSEQEELLRVKQEKEQREKENNRIEKEKKLKQKEKEKKLEAKKKKKLLEQKETEKKLQEQLRQQKKLQEKGKKLNQKDEKKV